MEITQKLAEQIHTEILRAQELAGQSKFPEAEDILTNALKLCPEHPDTNQVLGLVYLQQQNFKAACDHLQTSLKTVPEQPFVLASLGQALIALKDIDSAREAFLKAAELMPELGAAWGFLSEISKPRELPDLIEDIMQVFLKIENLSPETRIQLGYALTTCLEKLGRTEEAADTRQYYTYMQDIARQGGRPVHIAHPPEDVKITLMRARDHLAKGNFKRAEKISLGLLEKEPGKADALLVLGIAKGFLNDYDASVEYLRKGLALFPAQPGIWVKLGTAYRNIREFDKSVHCQNMALLYDPQCAEAIYWLGSAALGRGDDDLARSYIERAIACKPGFSQPYDLLRRIKGFEADESFLKALEKNTAAVDRSRVDAIFAHYALASHYYSQKNRAKFIHHTQLAKALQKETAPISIDKNVALTEASRKNFSKKIYKNQAADTDKLMTPVFIIGLHRSGSTLIEQILSQHPLVAAGDEIHFLYSHMLNRVEKETGLPYPEGLDSINSKIWGEIGRAYQKRLSQIAPETPFITDKLLSNAFYVGLIRLALPWARIIHINRNPMDRALSIFSNYFNDTLAHTFDLKHLARHTKLTKSVVDFWHEQCPGAILDVEYEDMVADIEGQTRRILDFCGLEWDPACLEFHKSERTVLTISVGQVHKPIYASSVGKWKQYADLLEPFQREMGDLIDEDGFLVGKR